VLLGAALIFAGILLAELKGHAPPIVPESLELDTHGSKEFQ